MQGIGAKYGFDRMGFIGTKWTGVGNVEMGGNGDRMCEVWISCNSQIRQG